MGGLKGKGACSALRRLPAGLGFRGQNNRGPNGKERTMSEVDFQKGPDRKPLESRASISGDSDGARFGDQLSPLITSVTAGHVLSFLAWGKSLAMAE